MTGAAPRVLFNLLSGFVKTTLPKRNSQFLIPISSSTRPSYVSCVKSGVIISTRRSKTISESILGEDDKSGSGDDPFAALGV